MRVTVTADFGRFKHQQVLESPTDISEYYRLMLREGGTDAGITDDQILKVIEEIPGDDEDTEVMRISKLESLVS